MPRNIFPHARSEGLVITDLDNEILVYDKARDKAHCLNRTAALVWKYSNGKRTVADIAQKMERDLHSPVDEQIVWFALAQLEKDHLLRDDFSLPKHLADISRREFVKKMGMAAVVVTLPMINSMTAPQSAPVSCIPNGGTCIDSLQCCAGLLCCTGTNRPARGPAVTICQPAQNCTV